MSKLSPGSWQKKKKGGSRKEVGIGDWRGRRRKAQQAMQIQEEDFQEPGFEVDRKQLFSDDFQALL